MGNQSNVKALRKQLRPMVQELLPTILTEELYKALSADIHSQVATIAENVKQTLKGIDDRAKDVQGYLVRQTAVAAPAVPTEEVKATETV